MKIYFKHSEKTLAEFFKKANKNFDSAYFDFYKEFYELLLCDGGDDDFASYNSSLIAVLMLLLVTEQDIKDYDNNMSTNEDEFYLQVYQTKKLILLETLFFTESKSN